MVSELLLRQSHVLLVAELGLERLFEPACFANRHVFDLGESFILLFNRDIHRRLLTII